jgi:hypothetical protein
MCIAGKLAMLDLVDITSAHIHLVLRKQTPTKVEVGQEMHTRSKKQGWRIMAS